MLQFFLSLIVLASLFDINTGQEPNNFNCSKYHSCQSSEKSCYCDAYCDQFRDCCYQPERTFDPQLDYPIVVCQDSIARIASCAKRWNGTDEFKTKCEKNAKDWKDPLLNIPWTKANSTQTYKNFYCALCNYDQYNATPWNVILKSEDLSATDILKKSLTTENLWKQFTYFSGASNWGVFISKQFYPLQFETQPQEIHKTRRCLTELIDTCPKDWGDEEIRRMCQSFLAPVYNGTIGYRNSYCAQCNEDNIVNFPCSDATKIPVKENTTRIIESFGLIVGWSFDVDGKNCNEGARWNPFLKSCQVVDCTDENMVYKNGICVLIPERNEVHKKRETTEEGIMEEDYLSFNADESIECVLTSFQELNDLKYGKSSDISYNSTFYFFDDKHAYSCEEKYNSSSNVTTPKVDGEISICKNSCASFSNYTITEENYLYLDEHNITLSRFFVINGEPCFCTNGDDCKMLVITKQQNPHFCHCAQITLDDNEYEVIDENNIFVSEYNKTYNSSWYDKMVDGVSICVDFDDFDKDRYERKFPPYMSHLTLIGILISIICILLHILAFCLIPEMRNLPGLDLTSLCIALLLGYTSFLCVQANAERTVCISIALCTNYFFLASFFWMNTISFDVWRSLYAATTTLRVSGKQSKWKRFFLYSAYSWLIPLVIVGLTLFFEVNPNVSPALKPDFGVDICWFENRYALFIFFGLPLIILLILNVLFFLFSSCIILMSSIKSSKDDSCPPRKNFKLYIRLAIMMGLTWITGILATVTNAEAVFVIFILLNTLQGLLIFVGFTCSNPGFKKLCKNAFSSAFRNNTSAPSNATEHSIPSTMMTYK